MTSVLSLGLIWVLKILKSYVCGIKRIVKESWQAARVGKFPRFRASAHPFSENGWTCLACGYQVWWELETQYAEYADMRTPAKPIAVSPQVIQRSIKSRNRAFFPRKITENEAKEEFLAAGAPLKYTKTYRLSGEHGNGRMVNVKNNREEAQILVGECVSYHANICKEKIKLSTRQKINNVGTNYYQE